MNLPGGFGASFGEGFQEAAPIQVVGEKGFAAIAAVHDVVNGPGVLDAKFAGVVQKKPPRINSKYANVRD
jgi:hypothetical protein